MAKKQTARRANGKEMDISPLVAASLAGIIYQARLFNRQARMNVPEEAVISEVVSLWHTVKDVLDRQKK